MKTTLKEIARESGYAVSTVSRVLNGSGKISTKTRDKIITVALDLNFPLYKINQPIGNYRTPNLRLVSDFSEGEFYASYFSGFTKGARSQNARLALTGISDPDNELMPTIIDLVSSDVDGIILFIPELTRAGYEEILKKLPKHYPIISNALIESPVISTVTFDGYSGGHKVAFHFEERGYGRVGIIKGPHIKADSRFRTNGFTDFCMQSDTLELVWSYDGKFTYESGVEAFANFAAQSNPPRAVFGSSDLMCLGFIEEAKRAGLSIPQDVAIIGYDDMPLCEHLHPKLSTINTNFTQLARATIQALIKQTKTNRDGAQQGTLSQIPVTLVERESS